MKIKTLSAVLVSAVALSTNSTSRAGDFHFPVGITYADGINKVWDGLEKVYAADGFTIEKSFVLPVGLSINPYYDIGNGLAIGLDFGPVAIIAVDQVGAGSSTVDYSFIIPVGADVRYTFLKDKDVSPYVRAGVRLPIVTGNIVDSSTAGVFGVVGIDFWRQNNVGMSFEVGYDTSKVTVKGPIAAKESVKFPGLTVSLCVRF